MPDIILIGGATASGKTEISQRIARYLDAEVINADSMQIYQEWFILSARPKFVSDIPHYLFGSVSVHENYSVGRWVKEVRACLKEIKQRKKTAIIVGGTGLYFKALTDGLAEIPFPDQSVFDYIRVLFTEKGAEGVLKEAQKLDPVATSKVKPQDQYRLTRILSVALGTSRILSEWQRDTHPVLYRNQWKGMIICFDRAVLYKRIERRFERMMQEGALEEVKQFISSNPDWSKPGAKILGAKLLYEYIKGHLSYESVVEQVKQETRRYAKRQMSWFRVQCHSWSQYFPDIEQFPDSEESAILEDDKKLHSFVEGALKTK